MPVGNVRQGSNHLLRPRPLVQNNHEWREKSSGAARIETDMGKRIQSDDLWYSQPPPTRLSASDRGVSRHPWWRCPRELLFPSRGHHKDVSFSISLTAFRGRYLMLNIEIFSSNKARLVMCISLRK